MDFGKIGRFLRQLRREKGITQEELSTIINIDRSAISKWERGIYPPSTEMLNTLAKLYNITVNEIILAEKKNDKNEEDLSDLPIALVKKNTKMIRLYHIIFGLGSFVALFIILLVYFISNYNSTRVYRAGGSSENYEVKNVLIVVSKHRSYLRFGDIIDYHDDDYTNYELYVKNGDERIILTNENTSDLIKNMERLNDYLQFNNQDEYLNELYVDIFDGINVETIKLNVKLEMTNNKIFYVSDDEPDDLEDDLEFVSKLNIINDESLPTFVRENFNYDYKKEAYVFTKNVNDVKTNFKYYNDLNLMIINIKIDNETVSFKYNYSLEQLEIFDNDSNERKRILGIQLESNMCTYGNCKQNKEYIDYFKKNYYKMIKK